MPDGTRRLRGKQSGPFPLANRSPPIRVAAPVSPSSCDFVDAQLVPSCNTYDPTVSCIADTFKWPEANNFALAKAYGSSPAATCFRTVEGMRLTKTITSAFSGICSDAIGQNIYDQSASSTLGCEIAPSTYAACIEIDGEARSEQAVFPGGPKCRFVVKLLNVFSSGRV